MARKKAQETYDLDALLSDGEEVVKQVAKPVYRNNFLQTGGAEIEGNDDQSKFMRVNIALYNMDKVDMTDPTAVKARIAEYFELHSREGVKPTVTGMGMALGVDRRRLWEIVTGNFGNTRGSLTQLPPETTDAIKKAYDFLETLWENYMENGKINPVSGIFLGKNNFGYQDKTEYVLTPNQNQEQNYDADSIKQRYLEDSQGLSEDSDD